MQQKQKKQEERKEGTSDYRKRPAPVELINCHVQPICSAQLVEIPQHDRLKAHEICRVKSDVFIGFAVGVNRTLHPSIIVRIAVSLFRVCT